MPSPNSNLLGAITSELAQANIAREPNIAGPAPPIWREPPEGAPGPGDMTGVTNDPLTVLSLFYSGGVVPPPGSHWERQTTVDLWIRTKGAGPARRAMDLEHAIRKQMLPLNESYRTDYFLGHGAEQMHVVECRLWRDIQRLGSSREQGYTFIVSYWFQLYDDV
jgi:hypothetical protein